MKLSLWLLENDLATSLSHATGLIMAGCVRVNGHVMRKSGISVRADDRVELMNHTVLYSRAALKLEHAIRMCNFSVAGHTFIDIGAAHGGFTQILLQQGACQVITVDVSYGQLHPNLRTDKRVIVIEKTNIYQLNWNTLPDTLSRFVIDLSFTSLRKLLPLLKTVRPHFEGLVLFKPQFEFKHTVREIKQLSSKSSISLDKGVVRNAKDRQLLLKSFFNFLDLYQITLVQYVPSAIKGRKGNQEYMLWLRW